MSNVDIVSLLGFVPGTFGFEAGVITTTPTCLTYLKIHAVNFMQFWVVALETLDDAL